MGESEETNGETVEGDEAAEDDGEEEDEESEEEVEIPKKFDKLRINGEALAETATLDSNLAKDGDDVSSTLADDDDSLAPIEKIDNRAVKKFAVKEPVEQEEDVEQEEEVAERPEIKIDTQAIAKNVKIKLAKSKNHTNINTRKRNIIKSKAKKDIRDTVKSYSG